MCLCNEKRAMCDCAVAYYVAVGLASAVAICVGAYQLWAGCRWLLRERVLLLRERERGCGA